MTGTSRWPRLIIAWSAGKIFLNARSPVAPKKTRASEWAAVMVLSSDLVTGLLEVAAELEPHRREHLVLVVGLAARGEALVEGGGEDGNGHRLVDGGLDRPSSFAGVGHVAGELLQVGILDEGRGRQVQEPGGDYA